MAGSSHTGSLPAAESGAARSAAKPAGADRSDGKRADTFQADEAKIARNMAAWDKLMALPVDDCGLLSRRKTMGFGF